MPGRSQAARDLAERMAAAWLSADIAAIVALFAPDGVFIAPGGRAQGHAAIAAVASSFFDTSYVAEIAIRRALLDGDQGAVEWTWSEASHSTHERRVMEDAIVFELRDGLLTYWREYFDPAQERPL